VIHGQGRFVAVGGDIDNADAMTSTDGLSWLSTTVADDGPGLTSLVDLAYGDGRYCATMETDMIFCSGDGIMWDIMDFDEKMILTGIAQGDGYTMAIGLMKDLNVVAFTSTDGAVWERSDPGSSEIPTGITYGWDRRFYVSGTSFLLMRTVDRTSGGGGGGCSTLPVADEPLWLELVLMALLLATFMRWRCRGNRNKR
jgi:hypothetical protein